MIKLRGFSIILIICILIGFYFWVLIEGIEGVYNASTPVHEKTVIHYVTQTVKSFNEQQELISLNNCDNLASSGDDALAYSQCVTAIIKDFK